MHENCSVRTFEMCVQEVIAGNRGLLQSEPALAGAPPGGRETGPRRKRVDY